MNFAGVVESRIVSSARCSPFVPERGSQQLRCRCGGQVWGTSGIALERGRGVGRHHPTQGARWARHGLYPFARRPGAAAETVDGMHLSFTRFAPMLTAVPRLLGSMDVEILAAASDEGSRARAPDVPLSMTPRRPAAERRKTRVAAKGDRGPEIRG